MSEQLSESPVLDLITTMTAESIEMSRLDHEQLMLTRLAALVAVGAPPASYLANLGAAAEIGIDEEKIRGVLTAVAPIVGTPRVVEAAANIFRALGIALDLIELERELEEHH